MRITATIENVEHVSSYPSVSSRTTKPQAQPLTRSEGAEFNQLVDSLIPCRNEDPELWFAEQAKEMALAKALCQQCPLAVACLEGAVEREEPWGVWGGEIIVDGKIVAVKRGRGRPRKVVEAA